MDAANSPTGPYSNNDDFDDDSDYGIGLDADDDSDRDIADDLDIDNADDDDYDDDIDLDNAIDYETKKNSGQDSDDKSILQNQRRIHHRTRPNPSTRRSVGRRQTLESEKQYKVCDERNLDAISRRALHHKSVVNKSDNKILFHTKEEALAALYQVVLAEYQKQEDRRQRADNNVQAVQTFINNNQ
jgi:hypothetical protein